MPSVGDSTEICEQAGRQFSVSVIVRPTPNPNFRRVDAVVEGGSGGSGVRLLNLATVQGRY